MTGTDERGHAEIEATYDAVARNYAAEFADDLAEKILDRALLSAFAETVGRAARVADLGCGPGFEARFLAELGLAVTGVDLAAGMIAEAQRRHAGVHGLEFVKGSLLALPFADASLAGAVAIYSVIHLDVGARARAYAEMARVVRPGGALLLSVHTSAVGFPAGSIRRLEEWWGHRVGLDGHFIAAEEVIAELGSVGFELTARLERGPSTPREFPSQRAYLLARRR
ncbi:Methyltransferase domain-containing protein [Nannocystis exedens]|uniref:Methyltransferase domain-containing protein n=1 Tax=Nannocystis exedens TaxID=54 RepID=A0A1I1WF32_9BACT|nr:class I SAM-dependent methyltransferase [Nannocystis exedens]PCC67673.1 Malonyl-[acyl-carrier protein] O-methyltransferase [Nannocystis exedens]SFD93786.1 Methyltransferase domain-containing protein [Nannocystis exedens]